MESEGIDVAGLYPRSVGFGGDQRPGRGGADRPGVQRLARTYCAARARPISRRGHGVPFQSPAEAGHECARAHDEPGFVARSCDRNRARTLDRRRTWTSRLGRSRGVGHGGGGARGFQRSARWGGLGSPASNFLVMLPSRKRSSRCSRRPAIAEGRHGPTNRAPRRFIASGWRDGCRIGWRDSTTRSTRTRTAPRRHLTRASTSPAVLGWRRDRTRGPSRASAPSAVERIVWG